ncbi:DUF1232 domain-containing protein [Caulobacter sp. 17J65-9]|uniref:DUF1232 domain-containing protein n=1 Tax=Caulobacter sp. 17J65-9 TaxID=2709382 RepID=UPI001969BAC8
MKRKKASRVFKLAKRQIDIFRFAVNDPRTPRAARLAGLGVLAYIASPIDLIPDFIPVLGQVDDIVVAGLGLMVIWKMIPKEVRRDARRMAAA